MTPKAAFDQIVARAEHLIALNGELTGGLPLTTHLTASDRTFLNDDVLRCALVLVVSALDRYVHDRVTKGVAAAFKNPTLTREQEDFAIPVKLAFEIAAKASKSNQFPRQTRAANIVRNQIQELLHKRPFQSWREIEIAFSLIGITGIAGHIQNAMGVGSIAPVKEQLNSIVRTRNLIVHEGHIRRHQRGGRPTLLEITSVEVTAAVTFLKQIVNHLESA